MEYKNKWLCSYETIYFDTPDNDIDIGQYALDKDGLGYYIRTRRKGESQFEWVPIEDEAGVPYDVSGLILVKTKPKNYTYYDEFLTAQGATELWTPTSEYYMVDPSQLPSGCVVRIQSEADKYKKLGTVPNEPQPSRTEIVEVLPPPEPTPDETTHHSIAFDAASNSGKQSNISSYTWSHTCTGANLLLAVGVGSRDPTFPYANLTGITYNAVAMSLARSDGTNTVAISSIYYLVAPDTGANTVSVSFSTTCSDSAGGGLSYTGVKQTAQPDAVNGATGSGVVPQTPTVDLTTVADNSWVISVVTTDANLTQYAMSCNNTQRWNIGSGYTAYQSGGSDTNGPKTPAGAQTMSWTISGTTYSKVWAISAASFAPAAAGGVNYPISISTAGLTASATIDREVAWDRGMSPGLTISATVARIYGRLRTLSSAGLTVSATIVRFYGRLRTTSPGLTVSVIVARKLAWDRGLSPGLTASTTIAIKRGWAAVVTAGLTVSATIARKLAWDRGLSPGLTVAITILKGWGRKIALTTAGLTVSATVAIQTGWKITTTAGLTVSTTVLRSLNRTIISAPGLTAAVTIARKLAWDRTVTPGLTVAVTILRSMGRKIALTTAGLTASATVVVKTGWKITTSPGLTVSTTVVVKTGWKIITTAGLTVSTTIARKVAWDKTISPGLTVAATIIKSMGWTITSSAGLTISATVAFLTSIRHRGSSHFKGGSITGSPSAALADLASKWEHSVERMRRKRRGG